MENTDSDFEDNPGFDIIEIHQLVKSGKKLEAVKLVKDATGWGLKEAKDYIDNLGGAIDFANTKSNVYESRDVNGLNIDLEPVKELLRNGRKLEAIKYFRDQSGLGLKESHEFIEQMASGKTVSYSGGKQIKQRSFSWNTNSGNNQSYTKTTVDGKEVKSGDENWEKVESILESVKNKNAINSDQLNQQLDEFFANPSKKKTTSTANTSGSSYTSKPASSQGSASWQNIPEPKKRKKDEFGYDKGEKGGSNIGLYLVVALIIAAIVFYLLKR